MKKFILLGVLVFCVAAQNVNAAQHVAASFLTASSVQVTNLLGITNLVSPAAVQGFSNTVGTVYTNIQGTRVIVAAGGAGETQNLLGDVPLWGNVDGRSVAFGLGLTGTTNANAAIFIRLVGGSGANTACTFLFAPVPDGEHEDTAAAELITVAVTSAGATEVTALVPIREALLIGCKSLRLRSITHPDADATSQVVVLDCKLVGFKP